MIQGNSFNQIRANAEAGANSIYGRTALPSIPSVVRDEALYDKLKNSITYGTTGIDREIINKGNIKVERW